MIERPPGQDWQEIVYRSFDGLQLFARHYPARGKTQERAVPLLCLPGMTRNSKDFHNLAMALSRDAQTPRDVYALDYRGRGRSEHDPAQNYTLRTEALDCLDFLTVADVHRVSILGTSRGGLLAMLLASQRPAALNTVILNDVGPQLQASGLGRVLSLVTKAPFPNDWEEAAEIVAKMYGRQFTDIKGAQWDDFARQYYDEEEGLPAPHYDPRLPEALGSMAMSKSGHAMWQEFRALRHFPLLLLRGENSDMLSDDTVVRMNTLHPRMQTHGVPNEGHAPLLRDVESIEKIAAFLRSNDP